jgi:hypothetical protein
MNLSMVRMFYAYLMEMMKKVYMMMIMQTRT